MGSNISSAAAQAHDASAASATETLRALSSSPIAAAAIKPSDLLIAELREVVQSAGAHFHPQSIRETDAEVAQAVIAHVDRFHAVAQQILATHFDAIAVRRGVTSSLAEQCAIINAALPALATESAALLRAVLTSVAEAEIRLLNGSSSQAGMNPSARGASQRNKAKLMIQLRLERSAQAVDAAVRRFSDALAANLPAAIDITMKPLHALLSEERWRTEGSTEVPKDAFVEHIVNSLIVVLDPPTAVEDGEMLALIHGSAAETATESDEKREKVSTRVQLHASRLMANAARRMESQTTAAIVQQTHERAESLYTVLTVETPANLRKLLDAKEKQLERLISEVHKFGCTPPMCATLTNAAGSQVIELDFAGARPSEFREVQVATNEVRTGRYCRISPAVIMLMVHQVHHANGVVEHAADTIVLAREDGVGWRNLDTGVVYNTIIPTVA